MSSAASSAVFDRRNKPIQEAFDNRNYKQALQLCEKRIKKGENTLFLQVCPVPYDILPVALPC